MTKVFITQQNMRRNEDGSIRPTFDLSLAAQHGELVRVFGHGSVALDPEGMRSGIIARIEEESFCPGQDLILPVGDPAIALAMGLTLGNRYGVESARIMHWDRQRREYFIINYGA